MPGVKLRRRLFVLAAAAIVPLAIMSGIGLFVLAQQQQAKAERAALEIARALLIGVDAELGRTIAVLETMSMSPMVDTENFPDFYQLARRITKARPHWVNITLSAPDGNHVLDTAYPYGSSKLPPLVEPETFKRVLLTAEPIVGQVRKRRGNFAFAVRVPVVRGGEIRYVLTGIVKPDSVLSVVQRQQLPDDWVVSVFDDRNMRVARSRLHEEFLGKPPAPGLIELMQQNIFEGTGLARTLEGDDVFTAYSKSPYTGWTVAIGIPPEFLSAGGQMSLAAFAGGVLLSILVAILAALLVVRSINRPIAALATAAHSLGRGEPLYPPVTDIKEIRDVADALLGASVERTHSEMEREQLLKREQEARTAAEAANRAKDEFLAMLGHELRNPLGAISNAAHLLEHPRTTPEVAGQARAIIGRQIDHLARMTDDLLDAARTITGKIALHRKPLDVAAATATTLGALKLRIDGHQLIQELEPVWVSADLTRIEQIITNLAENALKYTPAGGTVRVTVRKENGNAVLRVADDGIGMSPDLTAHVFELFVQGSRDLDRSHGGLGIGLTLVRRLAELHGGSVDARSAGPGQGSEFIVRLPSIPDTAAEKSAATVTHRATPRDILLIEDNDDLRESLTALLEYAGHRVRTASNGSAGLDAALTSPPEVALVDVGLPKLDGYEIARRIRAAHKEGQSRPVLVALTGYGRPEDRKRALEAGFDAHLVKPIDDTALEELLRSASAEQK